MGGYIFRTGKGDVIKLSLADATGVLNNRDIVVEMTMHENICIDLFMNAPIGII